MNIKFNFFKHVRKYVFRNYWSFSKKGKYQFSMVKCRGK